MSGIAAPPDWQTDPAKLRRIAVICGQHAYVYDHVRPSDHAVDGGRTWDLPLHMDVAQLCCWALDNGIGALWLLRWEQWDIPAVGNFEPLARRLIGESDEGLSPLAVHALSADRGRVLAGLVAQRCGEGGKGAGPLLMVYATWAGAWPVLSHLPEGHPAVRASLLALGVRLAAYQLGAQLRFSPTYTGRSLLRQSLAAKRYDLAAAGLSPEAYELVTDHLPHPVQWAGRMRLEAEHFFGEPATIYKYDRNASYLAAAAASSVPTGDPVPTEVYMPGCPGFYRVDVLAPFEWPRELPGPFHVGGGAGEYPGGGVAFGTWAWEPIIRLALRHGWMVDVIEGSYWPRQRCHQAYRDWATAVWDARTRCREYGGVPGELAAAICKQAGVATIGGIKQHSGRAIMSGEQARAEGLEVLSHAIDDAGDLTGDVTVAARMGRYDIDWPHHWATIIANANERLLEAVYGARGYHPTAAYVDAVYCASPWPTEAVESERLGKWKLESRTVAPAEQVARLNECESAEAWVKLLAAIRREEAGE